ncbi:hypothetical protein GLOIN_2v1781227 [Rhizophagus irregularis DAOM 181602=DAOM 197198]|nr:hypothetical protein GLOIN_2v1781227 [Rhizophagus irregularis DAOM 181602=DAOM 197198]
MAFSKILPELLGHLEMSVSTIKLLTFLSSNCNSISSLSYQCYNNYEHQQMMGLSQIIKSQKNLRKILFRSPLNQSLLSLKNSNYTKFVQQIININKPFKLKSLFLHEVSQFEPYDLLLQHFGCYLENFESRVDNEPQLLQLFKSVTKYCSKIKSLYLHLLWDYRNINLVFNLIENIKQSLNYLSIDLCYVANMTNDFHSIILQNLGQILPFKLEY